MAGLVTAIWARKLDETERRSGQRESNSHGTAWKAGSRPPRYPQTEPHAGVGPACRPYKRRMFPEQRGTELAASVGLASGPLPRATPSEGSQRWWRCRELNPQKLLAKHLRSPLHIPGSGSEPYGHVSPYATGATDSLLFPRRGARLPVGDSVESNHGLRCWNPLGHHNLYPKWCCITVSHCRAASCLFEKQQSPEVGSNHSRRT